MELRHLRYFVAVAVELLFRRAARRLDIAQPPLSQQIRRLEADLQTQLLRRTRRQVQLTEAGRIFLDEARATLLQAERAARLAQRASRGEIGQLAVGFVPWVDFTSVPQMIRIFGERYPRVELELHSLTVLEQMSALRDGRIHIGLLRPPVEGADLVTEPLLSEPLVVVFPQRHRFATYQRIPWRALTGEPYILFSPQRAPHYYSVIAHGCQEAGIRLNVRHEADNPQTVLALVEAGIGVSLVPASFERVRRPGVAHRGLRPVGPSIKTIMVWRRDDQSSPLVQAFRSVARETTRGPNGKGRLAGHPRSRRRA